MPQANFLPNLEYDVWLKPAGAAECQFSRCVFLNFFPSIRVIRRKLSNLLIFR
jgi:hypothetical protein